MRYHVSGDEGEQTVSDDEFNFMLKDITSHVFELAQEEGVDSIEPVFHLACISLGGSRSWGRAEVPELPDVDEIAATLMGTLGRVTFEQQGYIMAAFMVGIASVSKAKFGIIHKDLEDAIVIVGRTRDNRKNAAIVPLVDIGEGELVLSGDPNFILFAGSDTPQIGTPWLDALFAGEQARHEQGPNMPLDPRIHIEESPDMDGVVAGMMDLIAKPDITERMN